MVRCGIMQPRDSLLVSMDPMNSTLRLDGFVNTDIPMVTRLSRFVVLNLSFEAATVLCGWRPQPLRDHREPICDRRMPQIVVDKGHNI